MNDKVEREYWAMETANMLLEVMRQRRILIRIIADESLYEDKDQWCTRIIEKGMALRTLMDQLGVMVGPEKAELLLDEIKHTLDPVEAIAHG